MKIELKHYVEKLSRFSNKLDNLNILTEQPWITKLNDDNDRCVYIFRKENKELLISLNGAVEKGKWDYIPSMNSLIIERKTGTTLYKKGFFDDSVMILQIDGTDDFQLFANENRIESTLDKLLEKTEFKYLNNSKPIKENLIKRNTIITKKLKDGNNLEIHCTIKYVYGIGDKVTINGQIPQDGNYKISWLNSIDILNGLIKRLR
jgi:hypothetical protein